MASAARHHKVSPVDTVATVPPDGAIKLQQLYTIRQCNRKIYILRLRNIAYNLYIETRLLIIHNKKTNDQDSLESGFICTKKNK